GRNSAIFRLMGADASVSQLSSGRMRTPFDRSQLAPPGAGKHAGAQFARCPSPDASKQSSADCEHSGLGASAWAFVYSRRKGLGLLPQALDFMVGGHRIELWTSCL